MTGASRGVGLADAKLLVQEGARVIMTDVNEEAGLAAAEEIGENARFVKQDVSSEKGWKDLIAMVEKEYGQLDILVNNAAILQHNTLENESLEGFRRVMQINGESVFLGMQAAMPLLEKDGGGAIVNMASVAAQRAMPHFYAYGASKAAVQIMTKMTAVECHAKKNNVRCNCILPDGIATPMVMEMAGKIEMTGDKGAQAASYACAAEDVANTVLFLASDESKTINGISLPMDRSSSVTPPYL
ncbi:MAG: SDR family oxidoreductase [Pseudomonadales bacterium]|nr:MAG: SDR family oxidoreductase [Pseudomonadales bacterium]